VNYPPQGPLPGNFGAPQGHPGQWGPPPQQPPWPQQQWPPSPPPKKHNGWKWALGGVALLAVIGVTAAVAISVTSGSDDAESPSPPRDTYGLASANDTGPVEILTEDPSCTVWKPINDTLAEITKRGWEKRDASVPHPDWTPATREQYEEVGNAARAAANQAVAASKVTPHRVMRELYEQFIAYARAYDEAIATYTPMDDHLAGVWTNAAATITWICYAITYKSAEARAPLVESQEAHPAIAELSDPASPHRFMTNPEPICEEWHRLSDQLNADTTAWQELDPEVEGSQWTEEQRQIVEAVIPRLEHFDREISRLGQESSNPVVRDFAALSAIYDRAYTAALPSYRKTDAYLSGVAARSSAMIYQACKAAER